MAGRLEDRVALVSGGSRGIGLAIAQAYWQEGARVAVLATDAQRLDEAVATLGGAGERVMPWLADVADAGACASAVEAVLARWGRLDVLINNAGIYRARSFLDYSAQDFQEILDVNLFGVIHLMQAALPRMVEQGYGRIVNIASSAGKAGSRNQSAYNVSKHAVVGLTRCVALESALSGVTVNAICPGFVQTDMVEVLKTEVAQCAGVSEAQMLQAAVARVPMGRFLGTEEITGLAVYLGSAESSGMTGQAISVDGGLLTA